MKKLLLIGCLVALCAFSFAESPKREMRASWVATVENIDWPRTRITGTGEQAEQQRKTQKNELIAIFDRLVATNMNVALLQIRPMADALYPTEMTTWSRYLTNTRSKDPGYDPLRFAIDEAHKRGIELHGWMNPYRYENTGMTHPATDYMRAQHPEWILKIGDQSILNPGLPEVRTHIADVTREVIVNYPDIDGIVWDDYFYIAGISGEDNAAYQAYNPGNLSLSDWRRDNVNKTVKEVYDTIQACNPEILFGISPRGIWSVSSAAAAKYEVELPRGITGSDNYNSIYCDGLAWLSQGTIDYISPQLYWSTYSTGQDYDVLCPWWYSVAKKYDRHFYSSMGLYRNWEKSEYKLEVERNRETDPVAPGCIFFSDTNLATYGSYLRENCFTSPALRPVISWKTPKTLAAVTNLQLKNDSLVWDKSAQKYSVYLLPLTSTDDMAEMEKATNLLGVTYANAYNISNYIDHLATHKFAVRVMDGYANESAPAFFVNTATDMITTSEASEITQTSAKLNGTAMSTTAISEIGFEWKKEGENYTKIAGTLQSGYLTAELTGLTLNTKYIYRAFLTNESGTNYGREVTFVTKQKNPPILTTAAATDVTGTTAKLHGTATPTDDPIIAKGFEWKKENGTYKTETVTTSGTEFELELANLDFRTVYIYKTFATTETGTFYGEEQQFITGSSGEITETVVVKELWKKTRSDANYIYTGNEQRSMAYYDGKLYIPRITEAGTFVIVDAKTGEKIADKTAEYFSSKWNMMSVAISNDGQILFGSSLIGSSSITVNVSDRENGGVSKTETFSLPGFGRCDYFSFFGEFNTEEGGYLFALSNTSQKVLKVPVKNGEFGTPQTISNNKIPTGLSTKTLALGENELYLQTSTTIPSRHAVSNGNLLEEFGAVAPIEDPEGTSGMAIFTLLGHKYMVTPATNRGSIDIFDITNGLPEAQQVAKSTENIGNTENSAYTIGICATTSNDSAFIYVMAPNNGLAAYSVTLPKTDIANTAIENAKLTKTSEGVRIELRKNANIQIFSTNGTCLYQKENYSDVEIPLTNGVYIICIDGKPTKFVK